jgi:hypothetical protein
MKYIITDAEIEGKVQEIAVEKLGRKITADDVRLFSILNKAANSYNIADNRYFDDKLEEILLELESKGHISYDRGNSSIKIKRSFYELMIDILENSPEEHKVR